MSAEMDLETCMEQLDRARKLLAFLALPDIDFPEQERTSVRCLSATLLNMVVENLDRLLPADYDSPESEPVWDAIAQAQDVATDLLLVWYDETDQDNLAGESPIQRLTKRVFADAAQG